MNTYSSCLPTLLLSYDKIRHIEVDEKILAVFTIDSEGKTSDMFIALIERMKIIPVNFNKEHKAMLGHCKMILENDGGRIAINPEKFDKLITALRTPGNENSSYSESCQSRT